MEQHRTRPPQRRQAPQSPQPPQAPLSPQEGTIEEAATVYRAVRPPAGRRRPVPPVVLALRRLPNPRLTGIGAGLFAAVTMFVLACLDLVALDGSPAVFGVLFLPVCALTALWVRPADLVTAPIIVPIAFAVGIVPIAGGTGGLGGRIMAVVTALAVHAGWLYGGTLVAGVITTVRKVRQMRQRRRRTAVAPRTTGAARAPQGAPRRPRRREDAS
ncbi:DUF6542 domain-containing protein [Streptomyces sp. NPDC052095]|uniref:DUF6542 domain-containing protein n=1 Tax=unclassified Streptomyces TaxID=2593676 RepID=UPI00344D547C